MKTQKKSGGVWVGGWSGRVRGVRVDVNKEVFVKIKKIGGGSGQGVGSGGRVGGSGWM